jgi:hypothetical protein
MFQNKIKSVSFSKIVNVILIPSRQEYFDAELDSQMWWTEDNLQHTKLLAVTELRAVMAMQNIPYNQAIQNLYQPKKDTIFKCTEPINSDLSTYHNQPIS